MAFPNRAKRIGQILAAALILLLAAGRSTRADEPPASLGDIFRKAQQGPIAKEQEKTPETKDEVPPAATTSPVPKAYPSTGYPAITDKLASEQPQAGEKADAAPGDEAPEAEKKPDELSYADWGRQLRAEDKDEAAIAALTEALSLDPHDAVSYRERGFARLDVDAAEDALADFQQALQLNPADDDALWGRGRAYYEMNQYDSALADANDLLEKSADDPRFHRLRGHVFLDLGLYDWALDDYSNAVQLGPSDATNHRWRAEALYGLGRFAEAILEFDMAMRLDPGNASDVMLLAFVHGAQGDWPATIDGLTECLRVKPNSAELLLQRAAVYSLTGEPELAETDYLTAAVSASGYRLAKWEPVLFQPTADQTDLPDDAEPDPASIVAAFATSYSHHGVVVPVWFGGHWMRMIVDTGACCTVLDRRHADLLKSLGQSATLHTTSGWSEIALYEPIALTLGEATINTGPVGCTDLSVVAEMASSRVDGVLGFDVLAQFVFQLDLARHRCYLLRGCNDADGVIFPLVDSSSRKIDPGDSIGFRTLPEVEVDLAGVKTTLALDTGLLTAELGLAEDRYDALAKQREIMPLRESISGSLDRIDFRPTGLLARLSLGEFTHRNITVDQNWRSNMLGLQYFTRYVATFDFPNRRLLLKPSALFAAAEAELALRTGDPWVNTIGTHTPATALQHIDTMLVSLPKNAALYRARGLLDLREKDFDRAIADFCTAIKLDGATMELLYYRSLTYCYKKQWDEGTADMCQAIELEPYNPRLREARGRIWAARGDFERAIADVREAIRLYPEPSAQELLVALLKDHGDEEAKVVRPANVAKPANQSACGRPHARWRARRWARWCR